VLVANWPLLPGRLRGPTSAGGCSVTRVRITRIGARLLSLLGPATNPPLVLGLVVAATLIAADSLVVDLLKQIVPGNIFGVVFLLGVLVVASIWGFTLGAMTSLASAVVYVYFHHLVTRSSFLPAEARDAVAVLVFLLVALFANTLAGLARSGAVEANQRRREAEASRDQLSVLAEQRAALRRVATMVTRGVTPTDVFSSVAMELRFPDAAEVAAYYVVAEALTNAAKHAHASQVNVHTKTDGATLRLEVRDDGIGGADTGKGSGLTGLMDRVEALGGHMQISSQAGNGTAISVEIPFELRMTECGSSERQQSDQPR
jgi:K+-sensing histidine kinase KdpD